MAEGHRALEHVVLRGRGVRLVHIQQLAQVHDEGLSGGQLAGCNSLPAGNERLRRCCCCCLVHAVNDSGRHGASSGRESWATPQDVGQGVQPQPSKLHLAHQVNALQGEPQIIRRPKRRKVRPRTGDAAGATPRPQHAESGRATRAVSGVQPEPQGDANSGNQGKHSAGCPPAGAAVRCKWDGGAVLEGDDGRPARQGGVSP